MRHSGHIRTKVLFLFVLGAISDASQAAWAELQDDGRRRLGVFFKNGSGSNRPGNWVAADGHGGYYTGGTFKGLRRFGTNLFTGGPPAEGFVAKYDRLTNCIWARHIPNATAYGGAALGGEAVFIAGVVFGPVVLRDLKLGCDGPNDAYIAKLDSNGNFLWAKRLAKRLTGKHGASAWAVAVDAKGDLYFAGEFNGEATFDHTTIRASPNAASGELFIAKCDAAGNLLWVTQDADSHTSVRGMAVDEQHNVYLTGTFAGRGPFKAGVLAENAEDVFLAKYDRDGKPLWARAPGGPPKRAGLNVAVDGYGNPHVVGLLEGTDVFGPTNILVVDRKFNRNVFLARYNPAGDFQWVRQFRRGDFDFSNVISLESEGVNLPPPITSRSTIPTTNSEVDSLVSTNVMRALTDSKTAKPDSESQGVQKPFLRVQKIGEFIVLFWSKEFAGFELESTETLTPFPIWETVMAVPKVFEREYAVIIPVTAAQKYYRLRRVDEPGKQIRGAGF